MDKFYVIKLIPKQGQRGYVIDSPQGILIALGVTSDLKQFKTSDEARKFIKENKLEKNGTRAYIRDNEDLMREEEKNIGLSEADPNLVYLENIHGDKLFFDTKTQGYFWQKLDVGFCCWESEQELKKFVQEMNFSLKTFIKKVSSIK